MNEFLNMICINQMSCHNLAACALMFSVYNPQVRLCDVAAHLKSSFHWRTFKDIMSDITAVC